MSDGSLSPVLFFTGTSYAWNWNRETILQDFRVLENGQLELLWTNRNGTDGLLERLTMEKVTKIPIVVRGVFYGVSTDVSLNSIIPVHRKAFDNWLEEYINRLTKIYYVDGIPVYPIYHDIEVSEEKKEEYKKAIEDARPLPIRTAPILTIIREDAADYFSGSKSADEVIEVINNRGQLYLNERK